MTVFSGKELRDREKRESKIKKETDIHSLGLCTRMIFPDFSIQITPFDTFHTKDTLFERFHRSFNNNRRCLPFRRGNKKYANLGVNFPQIRCVVKLQIKVE